jgi:cell volume regulation protein A
VNPVELFLLTVAGIFLVGVLGELIFRATNVPDVVWLIAVGVVLGPLSGWVDREQLATVAPFFGAITLVIVLFDGGSRLRLHELSRAAPRSTLLAVLGFAFAMVTMAGLSMGAAALGILPAEWSWVHGLLLGAILGGSSSVVIMPAMQYARLEATLSNLVNLESALTDVLCVVVSGALITTLSGGTSDLGDAVGSLGRSFVIGVSVGGTMGLLWIMLHRHWKDSDHEYPLTLGALLVVYVVINAAGGSAALGILTAAVLMGNAVGISKKLGMAAPSSRLDPRLQAFHRHVTFMIKSFFFTFIGMMLGPPWSLMQFGAVLGVALLLSRYPAVAIAMSGKGFRSEERGLVWVALPRGMAAGVLAMMPHQAGVPATEGLPTVVFATVVTTILAFALGFPLMKRRLIRARPASAPPLDGGVTDATARDPGPPAASAPGFEATPRIT